MNDAEVRPTLSAVPGSPRELLRQFEGQRCFFLQYPGNNGDALIRLGAEQLLRSANLEVVDRMARADVIVMTGGFGISDRWRVGLAALKAAAAYRAIPLIVLPSSYEFQGTDLAMLLQHREAPTFLYCRERYSVERLRAFEFGPQVHVGLDHDMAMELAGSSFIEALKAKSAADYVLVVDRKDEENPDAARHQLTVTPSIVARLPFTRLLRAAVPFETRLRLRRMLLARRHARGSQGAPAWALSALRDCFPEFEHSATVTADVSVQEFYSFGEFTTAIARSAAVVTTRLHVGILAALLGKPTVLRSDALLKVRGVYEYSLSELANVKLWTGP